MTLRVVGAGLGRTGTMSLSIALKTLLGTPCYHMTEVFSRPDHIEMWHEAVRTGSTDWGRLFEGFGTAVDWPAAASWRELAVAYPDALILLSTRDAEGWWRSCDATIWEVFRRPPEGAPNAWLDMVTELLRKRFTENFLSRDEAIAAFDRHNDDVRATAPRERFVEWRPGTDGGRYVKRSASRSPTSHSLMRTRPTRSERWPGTMAKSVISFMML